MLSSDAITVPPPLRIWLRTVASAPFAPASVHVVFACHGCHSDQLLPSLEKRVSCPIPYR
jgi:hypothetical protein